jgi:hypothetical protein
MAGCTVQGGLYRGYDHNSVLIVDEVSMLAEGLLERLARWSLMGARFVFLGDFCQLLPVGQDEKRWRMEDSRVFKQLCNGLRICLTKNRRAAGDPEHFQRILELRSRVEARDGARSGPSCATIPGTARRSTTTSASLHQSRMRINRRENLAAAVAHDKKLFVPSVGEIERLLASQPQDMWIWEGLQLIGAGSRRKVLNGVLYIVVSFTEESISVRPHEDFQANAVQLSLAEASECLRLCYAAVYYSCQGRTLKEQHVMLLDTDHPHFSMRHLYVGASRVQHSKYLHSYNRMIISIWPSDRKGKKWMARVDETGQKVYFGQAGAEDFTTHKDEAKRKRWLARHKVEPWKPALNLTPAWLSRHLLWEKDDMNKAMAEASVMYPDIPLSLGRKTGALLLLPRRILKRRQSGESTSRSPRRSGRAPRAALRAGPSRACPRLVPPRPPPPPRPTSGRSYRKIWNEGTSSLRRPELRVMTVQHAGSNAP